MMTGLTKIKLCSLKRISLADAEVKVCLICDPAWLFGVGSCIFAGTNTN